MTRLVAVPLVYETNFATKTRKHEEEIEVYSSCLRALVAAFTTLFRGLFRSSVTTRRTLVSCRFLSGMGRHDSGSSTALARQWSRSRQFASQRHRRAGA